MASFSSGSTMRPTLTPPTPAVCPTSAWRLQSKATKSYCTQALTAPPMNLLRLGGSEVLLPLGRLTASLGPPATVAIFQEKSLGLQEFRHEYEVSNLLVWSTAPYLNIRSSPRSRHLLGVPPSATQGTRIVEVFSPL